MAVDAKRRHARQAALALVALGALGAGGAYALRARRQEAEAVAQKNAAVRAHQASIDALTRELASDDEAIAIAKREIVSAASEVARADAQAKLARAERDRRGRELSLAALQGLAAPPARTPARIGCSCDAGDPLCSML